MKIFFDTNILVSAFTGSGICLDIVKLAVEDTRHSMVIGSVVLDECIRVLSKKFHYPQEKLELVDALLRRHRRVLTPKTHSPIPVRDPDDELVLASALEAKADILVTGDRDLLELDGQAGITIVDPHALGNVLERIA